MKTVNINITDARSLEHAMDKAIEEAEGKCHLVDKTYRVNKVRFIMLSAEVSYHGKTFTYYFEADLEEV